MFMITLTMMMNLVKHDDIDDVDLYDWDDDEEGDPDQGRVRPNVCSWCLHVRADDCWQLLLYWPTGHHDGDDAANGDNDNDDSDIDDEE